MLRQRPVQSGEAATRSLAKGMLPSLLGYHLRRAQVAVFQNFAQAVAEFDVTPGHGGIEVVVAASAPDDPIRDIHVWMPGFENARSPFHPLFSRI